MRQFYAILLVLGGIALGACVAPQLSPAPTTAATDPTTVATEPSKWEYKIEADSSSPFRYVGEKELNELGSQGWEMIGFALTESNQYGARSFRYVFKRPKAN